MDAMQKNAFRWVIGDRVRLADPERWIQPLRRLGHEGRVATVESVFIPPGGCRVVVRVRFDTKRANAKPIVEFVDESDLHADQLIHSGRAEIGGPK